MAERWVCDWQDCGEVIPNDKLHYLDGGRRANGDVRGEQDLASTLPRPIHLCPRHFAKVLRNVGFSAGDD